MKKIGFYLFVGGLGSSILSLMDLNFKLLLWIDMWGETTGWIIRGGLAALGLLLMVAGKSQAAAEAPLSTSKPTGS